MSFWRKKQENVIPPVVDSNRDELFRSRATNSTSPLPPDSRFSSTTYVAGRENVLRKPNPAPNGMAPPAPREYSRQDAARYIGQKGVGDVYSRGQGDLQQDRNALFTGYKPKEGSGRFFDNDRAGGLSPRDGTSPPGEKDEDDEVEGIKQDMRNLKQESVNSTRNALRIAREAEETAVATLQKLTDQSEKLANTDRQLDVALGHTRRAKDNAEELKQLNRSIFRPVITFNKDKKREAQEREQQEAYERDRDERERQAGDVRQSQKRLQEATTYRANDEEGINTQAQRRAQRSRYQFEADEEDDRVEDEIDDNLDEMANLTGRMKVLATAMNKEIDSHNTRLKRMEDKTDDVDIRVQTVNRKLERIK